MAGPPFNLDITNPSDTGITAQFPANERTFRDNIASYINTEHDINTGFHKFQILTTTQIGNLTTPPTGMLAYNSTAGQLQINTGTSVSPVWTATIIGNPPGTVIDFAGVSAPAGYLVCDGSAVSRTTYANLFNAIGVVWGNGDGVTTFNLPNLNRRVTVGSGGTGSSELGNTVGSVGGEENHTMQSAEVAPHTHPATVTDPGHTHTVPILAGSPSGTASPIGSNQSPSTTIIANSATTGISVTVDNNTGAAPFNVIQPSAVVLKCIKT